jgi:hypothetical protein
MLPLLNPHIELLTEFAQTTPVLSTNIELLPEFVTRSLQMSKLQRQTSVCRTLCRFSISPE